MVVSYSKPRLRRTFDIVIPIDNNDTSSGGSTVIFKSEHQTIKFKGNQKFIEKVISLLNGNNTLEQIFASLSSGGYRREDINRCITLLAQHNLIEEGKIMVNSIDSSYVADNDRLNKSNPQIEFFKDIGVNVDTALKRMKQSKIVIIGLGAHGAVLALALANEGIGHIKCLDPSLVSDQDLYLSSAAAIYQKKDVGKRRENAFFEYSQNTFLSTKFEISNLQNVTEEELEKWIDADNCDFAVCCIDKGFLSIYYWLNKIALRKKSFSWCAASIEGVEGVIGPMIIPGETACYMCYKMRTAAASEKSYADAMAYYEYLDNNEKDELYRRSNIGIAPGIVGNFVAAEVMKAVIGLGSPLIGKTSLLGRICVISFLNLTTQFHKILKRPDCPHCGLKKNIDVFSTATQHLLGTKDDDHSRTTTTTTTTSTQGPVLLQIESDLVSPKLGIIKNINRLQKDASEPVIPYVFEAFISNFSSGSNNGDISDSDSSNSNFLWYSSGKGLTLQEAKLSALGKAIERYCASQYDEKKIRFTSYKELVKDKNTDTDVINPPLDLVLYSDEQYNSGLLPYKKFNEDVVLGWVEGQSLITNKKILVPAIAVYLNYRSTNKNNEFLLPPTLTTGLATGSTYSEAILNGLLEVIERDAFLITWLCKLPMPKVDLCSVIQNNSNINNAISDIVKAYERRNVTVNVNALLLDTKNIPTFIATAIDTSGKMDSPVAVIGLGSHPNPEVAILKAILEAGQSHQDLKRKIRNPKYIDKLATIKRKFENIKMIEDHALVYTDIQMLGAFDFLLQNGSSIDVSKLPRNNISGQESLDEQLLSYCINNLHKIGADVISVDVTTRDISSLGLFVARVFITGFQPIHFGGFNDKEARLGGSRLFDLPQKLGFYGRSLRVKELNTFPHPFGRT